MKTKVNSIDKICELMNKNKGYITSSELDKNGIHRMYLKMLLKKKIIRNYIRITYVINILYILILQLYIYII